MFNLLPVAIATVSSFALGALWYSVLFGKIWAQAAGVSETQMKNAGFTPYVISFICSLLAAIGFQKLVMNSASLEQNIFVGALVGVLVALSLCINYQFSGRDTKVLLIDAGYHIARFVAYALVFWFVK